MTTEALPMCTVMVPVKAFRQAKRRLAPALGAVQRKELAMTMAMTVVKAASPLPVAVLCDDEEVAAWAGGVGAAVIWSRKAGLSAAVEDGVAQLAERGAQHVMIVHADLPHAREIASLAGWSGVTLVPDRHLDGTNAICVPVGSGFCFSFGARSFQAHVAEAARKSLPLRIVRDQLLGWDIDLPADLEGLASIPLEIASTPGPATPRL